MASRERVEWDGIGALYATYVYDNSTITYDATQAGGSSVVGKAVTLANTAGVISTVADGEYVLGKLIKVESDGKCAVQVKGYMTLPGGSGASLTRGKGIVGCLGGAAEGYIREVATATAAELGVQNGAIQDAATTTAVWVLL